MAGIHSLFDAMDADWWIAAYVTAAFLLTVWVCCQLVRLAWSYLEPTIFDLRFTLKDRLRVWRYRLRIARKEGHGISPASSRMAATALRSRVRRDVRQRFGARLSEFGDSLASLVDLGGNTHGRQFDHDERSDWPIPLPADRASQVSMTPKDAA